MATLTESAAVFEPKLKDLGLDGCKDAMAGVEHALDFCFTK